MVHFKEAIALPFQNFKNLTLGALFFSISSAASALGTYAQDNPQLLTFQIGLSFLGILISLVASGYALITARTAIKHKFVLLEFDGLFNFFIKGLLAAIIFFIYSLPVLLLLFITAIVAVFSSFSLNPAALLSMIPAVFVLFILMLLVIYVAPAALLAYIEKDNFARAFDVRFVFSKAFTGLWLGATLASILYSFALLLGAGLLAFIFNLIPLPPLSILLTAIVTSYVSMITTLTYYTMLADAYGEIK
ncbi:MAG TPA: DUF4013 domain-containing protein [Candidatus Nanoarchaeia archaeon]|nr:DUF4013 domain-containing protein [Candidatus Nanoarchaeia archaeon]